MRHQIPTKFFTLLCVILGWVALPALAENSIDQVTPNGLNYMGFNNTTIAVSAAPAIVGQCMACHGPAGLSQNPQWPNLAGQQTEYLVQQLKDFRTGERKNGMMKVVTDGLTDEDIHAAAEYFSKLNPTN